jgi:predicted permease
MLSAFWRRLTSMLRRDQLANELDEEIRAHYEDLRQALEDEGRTPAEAARLARIRLGGALQIRESSHDAWRLGGVEGAWQDLRLAARSLRRRPGFAVAAIATLALGIGASTAIFSVAYGVSLRPLPYPNPDRLIRIYESNPANHQPEQDVSDGAFQAWREGAPSIESMALHSKGASQTIALGADRVKVTTMSVTPAFFDVLGVRPVLGPGFKPEREYTRFTTKDVVLSYDAWQRFFEGRPDIIDHTVTAVSGNADDVYRIVGVMPRHFSYGVAADMWRPQIIELPVARILYNWRYDRVVARLKPGATIEQARAELDAAAARLAVERPASNGGWTVTVKTLHDSVIGEFGNATWLLLAGVAVVLLVACLNVGGLLVARAVARERETALRAALGAGRWRLMRLWMAEAAIVAVTGGSLGWQFAWLGVSALKAAAPPGIPRLDAVEMDWTTLTVMAVSTFVAMTAFTIAPASRLRRNLASGSLREGTAGSGDSRGRQATRAAVTMVQCAGAAALVVLAALLTRSFVNRMSFDLGWDSARTLSLRVAPPMPRELRRPWYRFVEWSDRAIAALEATPGIASAAITSQVPLSATTFPAPLAIGRERSAAQQQWAGVHHNVTDGYFALLGVTLRAGRLFTSGDRFSEAELNGPASRESGVAIVTETTARTLWPGLDPLGQVVRLPDNDDVEWREVVGVVEDIQFYGVGEDATLHVFIPWTQGRHGAPRLLVRGTTDTPSIAQVRQVLESVEPGTDVDDVAALDSLVARATAQPRFTSRLVVSFGALALALAAVGIYGTQAYLVGSRTRELGIRLALGASRVSVLALVLRRGLVPAIAGGAIGLVAAVALARAFRALLFDVEPLDPTSLAGGAAVLLIVATVAALGPARRASRIDPVRALRTE